jgi:two-component system, OmpR family, sensor histidine kinase VicK
MYDTETEPLELEEVRVIHNSKFILKKCIAIIKSANNEIEWVSHNSRTVFYQSEIFETLRSLKKNIKIKLLIQKIESNKSTNSEFDNQYYKNIEFREIEGFPGSFIPSFFVVDKSVVLLVILKNNLAANFAENIDFGIISRRRNFVASYHQTFELLWHQTDLYEQIIQKNLQLERKNQETIDLYSDLSISFQSLAEINKQLRSANQEIERQKDKQTEFFNMAAHEIRTPVQSILGYFEMIKRCPENLLKYIEPLDRNLNRLYRLTEDVLYIAKIDNNNLKLDKSNFDIIQLITEILKDFIKESKSKNNNNNFKLLLYYNDYDYYIYTKNKINKNEKIKKEEGKELYVNADRMRIQQVLYNLLNNAIRFTQNGHIIVKIKKQESDNKASISIHDNGKGIDPEILPRLFTKFMSTEYDGGTGLGLYISKNIIEKHGGKIWGRNNLKSKKGAEFGFLLPLA